jgi:Uma2 family endonuclease
MSHAVHSGQPMTLAEFDALPEDNTRRYEIEDGLLLVNARPAGPHIKAASRLLVQIAAQLPAGLEAVAEPEMELPEPSPRRVPDVAVVPSDWDSARIAGKHVALAVEIVSPGESWFRDYVKKPAEYAAAGIAVLWVVDVLQRPSTLTAYTLADGETEYHIHAPLTGVCTPQAPWPVRIDLAALAG